MTGPQHFSAGEVRLEASCDARGEGRMADAMHDAAMAKAHFLAALVALGATTAQNRSVSWQEVLAP